MTYEVWKSKVRHTYVNRKFDEKVCAISQFSRGASKGSIAVFPEMCSSQSLKLGLTERGDMHWRSQRHLRLSSELQVYPNWGE